MEIQSQHKQQTENIVIYLRLFRRTWILVEKGGESYKHGGFELESRVVDQSA